MSSHKIDIRGSNFNVYSPQLELNDTWLNINLGIWEPQTFKVISELVDESSCALEIGIDLGQTLLYTATKAGKLIAVEPNLISYNLVKKHLDLNLDLQKKVILVHGALSDARKEVFFGKGSKLFDDIHFKSNYKEVKVQGYLLEDFEAMVESPITFINMDIEGGEYICIGAMGSYLRKNQTTLLLSLHPGFLLSQKQSRLPIFFRYIKRIKEQGKIFRVVKNYPFIYDVLTMKKISPYSLYTIKYLRSKNALNSQILCTYKELNHEGDYRV